MEQSHQIEEGYYKTRAYRDGPWIPIRVWLEDGERDTETGELLSDQTWKAEQNNSDDPYLWEPTNPFHEKNIYWRKITKEEFKWITTLKTL